MRRLLLLLLLLQDEEVAKYKPELTRPADFKEFWKKQLDGLPKIEPKLEKVEKASTAKVTAYDLKYASADGATEVWGWISIPVSGAKLPAVVQIPAFGGRRGEAPPRRQDAVSLVVGYRGDGDAPWPGDWITRGLDKAENSVFRTHYLNLVQAIRYLQSRAEVDPKKIFLQGGSLGGALCVVVAGLLGKEIAGIVASEPGMDYYFLKDGSPVESSFKQMEQFVAKNPDRKETILKILGYYAPLNFAPDVTCDALFSCGGKDTLCTPRMVHAVYNHLGGAKEMKFYAEATHGGGPGLKDEWPKAVTDWFSKRLK